ncbi:MAG: aldolase [Alphaproteobacteria bacterium]|nr:aldolase [Alphaproteobacteria bacterium]
MVTVTNVTKEKLKRGDIALGVGIRNARTVDIGKAMKTAGFDWLFIDMEHNAMGIDIACQIAVAGQDAGITPIVRVPGFEHHLAARALDGGAQGIVFPHVDDAETAAKLVSYCRYPPHGKRSMTGALPQLDFKSYPPGETAEGVNDATFVVMMLETPQAIANADAMAAVPGVDALLIGTNDLCMEMGIPGQFTHEKVVNAYKTMIAACEKHGKFPGMGGVYAPDQMKIYTDLGARFILSGNDFSFMMSGAKAQAAAVRGLVG